MHSSIPQPESDRGAREAKDAIRRSRRPPSQITMLRRMFGASVRGENYARAEIVAGRVGPDQAAARREFD